MLGFPIIAFSVPLRLRGEKFSTDPLCVVAEC
jgi:hypothetical protein